MKSLFHRLGTSFCNFLNRKIPVRVKRLILLPALYGRVAKQQKQTINRDTLRKLQEVMNITSSEGREDAMGVPIALSGLIWGGVEVDLICHDWCKGNKEGLLKQLVSLVPKPLQYPDMKVDIKRLLDAFPSGKVNV